MEEFSNQRWIYHRRFENILQGAMIVLVVVALLVLAFAPEENAGASVHANSPARKSGSHSLNLSKQPARNSN
jgi:beta-lactamase regulating signal transducer with metallopeptidase domain